MVERCIIIFPQFENEYIIDKIREKNDPLFNHVRPHITLVFPFESSIETFQLREHITEQISECDKFKITLKDITPSIAFGRYLFLNVHEGSGQIIDLHKRLYKGILKDYYPDWLKEGIYLPHMTIGNFDSEEDLNKAVAETKDLSDTFKTIVDKVSVEIIDENEDSIIETEVPLR